MVAASRSSAGVPSPAPGAFTQDATRAVGQFDYTPPAPGSYALPIIKPAADGAVLDDTGASRRLRELTRGAITVMSFIYTRCTDVRACPYATGVLRDLHRTASQYPTMPGRVRLISLSFDPDIDTPARMAAYAEWARNRNLPIDWQFLTTRSPAEVKPILDAYGQAVDRRRNPGAIQGPLNHTLRVYLIDHQGNIRNIYGADTLDPRLVMTDIQTLLLEERGVTPGSQPSPPKSP
jgi:cytochrome oxidase Cu insertion factor (SCO1/SenC/PrrC family)